MTNEELTELRATLIQLTKAQERQIDAEKRIIAMLEKWLGVRPQAIAQAVNASIAGVVGPVTTT